MKVRRIVAHLKATNMASKTSVLDVERAAVKIALIIFSKRLENS